MSTSGMVIDVIISIICGIGDYVVDRHIILLQTTSGDGILILLFPTKTDHGMDTSVPYAQHPVDVYIAPMTVKG